MDTLNRITIQGFKSIRDLSLDIRPINVLVGPNGAGKSNLIAFFRMLNEMTGARLQQFIAASGRAQSLLYVGPKTTPQLTATLEFETERGHNTYHLRLFHAAGDTLVFAEEALSFLQAGRTGEPKLMSLGAGHLESRVVEEAERGEPTAKVFRDLLNHCRVYHFHDTSPTAGVRQYCYVGDNRWLMNDAKNLAAVLLRMKVEVSDCYHRIVSTVRLVAPFFADFVLEPGGPARRDITLNWRGVDSDEVFGPHQLSDGTLRAMCLIALLLQPEDSLPDFIVVDEPELGLHPYALNIVASLFRETASRARILISTQSGGFLDNFEPEDIIVVERQHGESVFTRPEPAALDAWLEEYSLGETWEKNVIGGGPH